jgi:hypothetical protein
MAAVDVIALMMIKPQSSQPSVSWVRSANGSAFNAAALMLTKPHSSQAGVFWI